MNKKIIALIGAVALLSACETASKKMVSGSASSSSGSTSSSTSSSVEKKTSSVDKKKSFMIGDKVSDKKCAQNSNLKFEYAKNNFESLVKKIVK